MTSGTVATLSDRVREQLHGALGASLTFEEDVIKGYTRDHSAVMPTGTPVALVRPDHAHGVADTLRIASEHGLPVVPRGAGTGLSGGAVASPMCILLSLERMNRVVSIDPVERLIVVEPGVVTSELRRAAAPYGLWYAPDPSSHDTCTIGGNIATDAGGLCCVKYGTTRHAVAELEVALAGGTLVRLGRRTRKGAVGYDLVNLIVGSEGTLGVVTQATMRLMARPATPTTLVATVPTEAALGEALTSIHQVGPNPSLFEVMDQTTIRAVEDMVNMGLDRSAAGLVFLQFDDGDRAVSARRASAALSASGAGDCYVTDDFDEGEQFLAARRVALTAIERIGETLLDDICVPVGQVGRALSEIAAIGRRCGLTIATFGHAGDGNLHPTIVIDEPQATVQAFDAILELARTLGGTVTGEHGVGTLKRAHARSELGPDVVALHAAVKSALDPAHILNPGRAW